MSAEATGGNSTPILQLSDLKLTSLPEKFFQTDCSITIETNIALTECFIATMRKHGYTDELLHPFVRSAVFSSIHPNTPHVQHAMVKRAIAISEGQNLGVNQYSISALLMSYKEAYAGNANEQIYTGSHASIDSSITSCASHNQHHDCLSSTISSTSMCEANI